MKQKILLMGKSGAGKTSMRSIIFANYIARDTRRIGATIDVEHSHVRFLGNLVLSLWDCGGQETFMENYFASQRESIFCNVEVLIYVFDVESREFEKDHHYYQSCLEAMLQNSPSAKIFCLIHKMDLIKVDKPKVFRDRTDELRRLSKPLQITCYPTSIWDESLYRAWSAIIYNLIPNVREIENGLSNFASIIDADEVLLFEKATFLVISYCQRREHIDPNRFEKVSNIIKQFKLSCSKLGTAFQSMEIRNSNFAAFIDLFTINTYVMVVISDPTVPASHIHSLSVMMVEPNDNFHTNTTPNYENFVEKHPQFANYDVDGKDVTHYPHIIEGAVYWDEYDAQFYNESTYWDIGERVSQVFKLLNADHINLNFKLVAVYPYPADKVLMNNVAANLVEFGKYISEDPMRKNYDAGIMLSTRIADDRHVAMAYMDSLCDERYSAVVVRLKVESCPQPISHELSHLFGYEHDSPKVCGDREMTSSQPMDYPNGTYAWSECTRYQLAKGLK